MAIKKVEVRPSEGDFNDVLYPKTSVDMVVDEEAAQTLDVTLSELKSDIQRVEDKLNSPILQESEVYSVTKSGKDADGVFTTVEYRRKENNTLAITSVLSGGTAPKYTTRTVTYYDGSGVTVDKVYTFALTYDPSGALVSEV